jgi:nucleoid-associated protein YgaU
MNNKFLFIIIGLLVLFLLALAHCSRPDVPEITPTLSISATPSDTPAPPTPTSTTVAPVAISPLPASGTAVVTPPPATAVPDTSTPVETPNPPPTVPTRTATPTPKPPMPTERPSHWLVQPGDNLSRISGWLCGRQDWGWIYRENADQIRDPNIIFSGQRLAIPWPCEE